MHCQSCGSKVPDGASVCPSCQHVIGTTPSAVATSALTPPDGVVQPQPPRPEELDELAQRLQTALGAGYAVEKPLGAGGFAVVYLVRDLSLKRKLAAKVLSPDLITSKTVLERFRREAETVAQLSHPHIVPLHFIGQKDDLLYLVMECIEGGSLADRLDNEGKLAVDEAIRILREVAGALAYAHKRGVIHRDIKPQNVLLEAETGRTLVTDFGIARTETGSSLTASGMLVGTPAYLSPEQIMGQPTDHRADIYALGVMAYEMLTGEPPFQGPTPTAVLMKRIGSTPQPIVKLRPDVPEVVRDVVDACLAQDPDERFQNAGDVVRALGGQTPVSGGHQTAELTVRRRRELRQRRNVFLALGTGAVLGLAALTWALTSSRNGAIATVAAVDPGMAVIPGGTYTIGSSDGPELTRPAHAVRLDSFGIGFNEVTVGEYAEYVATGRATAPWTSPPRATLPVTGVLYAEAANYCAWRHPDGGRLPTEQEWEAAARGREARRYPWGNEWNPASANTISSPRRAPAPVGSHPMGRSPEGAHDLIGNVWEWTSSQAGNYPGGSGAARDAGSYVIRGGAFNSFDAIATATFRGLANPTAPRSDLAATGFRCAMSVRRPT
jgi:formylglycine-generating enzyme required for sulfatase activity/tRNA A-37 threonylcarbamoyl transferase component Bud32